MGKESRKAFAATLSIKVGPLGPVAAATVCLAVLCTTQSHAATPPLTSSDKEAQKLFAVVLARERPPGRCQYDVSWSREELPDYIAQSEFHLTVKVGLLPPSVTGDFRTIVDLNHHIAASAFCSEEDLKTYTAQRVAEFEKGSEPNMQIDRTAFDYPISTTPEPKRLS